MSRFLWFTVYISTLQTKTSLGACRNCLCWLPGLSGSPSTSSTPTDQPQKKPAGQMYSASGAVCSAVADQQIGDDAVTWHQRLVGRRRAGTAALDHVDSYTSWHWACTWFVWYIKPMQLSVKKPRQASLELLRGGNHSSHSMQHSLQLVCCPRGIERVQAQHSLTFRIRRYVVIARKPVHRMQICPTVHN